jgi:NTP pyrophosphatase (non-canonical NTP hydrolase)
MELTLSELLKKIVAFRDKRSWGQFHTPRHLASALSIEAGEIQETFLWKSDEEVTNFIRTNRGKQKLEEEIADVLILSLLLSDRIGISPSKAIQRKLHINALKYPVRLAKGTAAKYTELKKLR